MRTARVALIIGLASIAGCGKKKAAPAAQGSAAESAADPAGSAKLAPVLQPTENKLEHAMDKEDKRASPDPEASGTTGPGN